MWGVNQFLDNNKIIILIAFKEKKKCVFGAWSTSEFFAVFEIIKKNKIHSLL